MSPRFAEFLDACLNDQAGAARMLGEDPSLLDVRSGLGETVLHYAAIEAGTEAVRFLLAHGADANAKNGFGDSVLQECVSICQPGWDLTPIVALLLKAGADPYHSTLTGACAWHRATRQEFAPLRALFAALPPPVGPHEDCEDFTAFLPDEDLRDEADGDAAL